MDLAEQQPVRIDELTAHDDRVAAAALLAGIWGVPPAESPVPSDVMTALTHAGGCVLGARTPDGTLVGVTIGFAGAPGSQRVYSYIAGVDSSFAGRGLGRLLKLAQRDWALQRGAAILTWTYDPLIRRNGHFNLNRLGGRVTGFVRDYYPPMLDAVNAGDLTDRFEVEWTLADEPGGRPLPEGAGASPVVLAAGAGDEPEVRHRELGVIEGPDVVDGPDAVDESEPAGESEPSGAIAGPEPTGTSAGSGAIAGEVVRAWVPSDIERLRGGDPALGRRWRLAAREVFGVLFAAGFRPVGIDPDGHYVFVKGA